MKIPLANGHLPWLLLYPSFCSVFLMTMIIGISIFLTWLLMNVVILVYILERRNIFKLDWCLAHIMKDSSVLLLTCFSKSFVLFVWTCTKYISVLELYIPNFDRDERGYKKKDELHPQYHYFYHIQRWISKLHKNT